MDLKAFVEAINVSQGKGTAQLCFTNGIVADVFSGEFLTDVDVLVDNGMVVDCVKTGSREAKETIDLKGTYLLPGFIDTHVHIESSMLSPERFSDLVVPHGTSVVIADPHEIANVAGKAGIEYMLKAAEHTPLDIRFMLPSCVPATPFENSGAILKAEDLREFYGHPKVLGLAEVMNIPGVLMGDADLMQKLIDAQQRDVAIDGHAPMFLGSQLSACALAGIGSDHECSTVEELKERIRRGMAVNIREGSAAKNFEALIQGVTDENAPMCFFCTDDANPSDIQTRGHMEKHLRMAVAAGIKPMTALRMATVYAARHYGLRKIGAIAPGYRADFAIVNNLKDFKVCDVYLKGEHVAHDGSCLRSVEVLHQPTTVLSSVKTAPVSEESLLMELKTSSIRVIDVLPNQILTESGTQTVNGDKHFQATLNPGLVKIAVIERHHEKASIGLGVLRGYIKENTLMNGAIATTIAHDSHNVVIAGGADADMVLAHDTLKAMGGGMVVVKDHKVLATFALPIGGLMSDGESQDVIVGQSALYETAHQAFDFADGVEPVMTLAFMSLPVIPHLRVTDCGLFDVDRFAFTTLDV